MEKFALHLAVELLGPDKVINYLDGNENRVPLYWRSKLMVSDPSGTLYHFGEKNNDSIPSLTDFNLPKVLFFDAAFDFFKEQQAQDPREQEENVVYRDGSSLEQQKPLSCNASVTLGFFLLLPSARRDSENKGRCIGGGHYVSTRSLDHSQLMSHIESLQLDPQSVTAASLACSMAREFLRQGPLSSNNESEKVDQTQHLTAKYVYSSADCASIKKEETAHGNKTDRSALNTYSQTHSQTFDYLPNNCDIRLDIPYKSIGSTTGTFFLKLSSEDGVRKYDKAALRFLYWDFSKNTNHYHPPETNEDSSISRKHHLVEDAFDRWRTRVVSTTHSSNGNETVESNDKDARNPGIERSSTNALPAATASSSAHNHDNKKRKIFRGASILPSARRKRSRGLVYDKN